MKRNVFAFWLAFLLGGAIAIAQQAVSVQRAGYSTNQDTCTGGICNISGTGGTSVILDGGLRMYGAPPPISRTGGHVLCGSVDTTEGACWFSQDTLLADGGINHNEDDNNYGITGNGSTTQLNGGGQTRIAVYDRGAVLVGPVAVSGDQPDVRIRNRLEVTPWGEDFDAGTAGTLTCSVGITATVGNSHDQGLIFRNLDGSKDWILEKSTTAGTLALGAGGTHHTLWNNSTGVVTFQFGIDATGRIVASSSTNKGTITLSGGGTGTATVTSGAKCVCSYSTVGIIVPLCNVSGTTLTATGTASADMNYICL